MQHQINYRKLGRDTAHRKAMLGNLVASIILHDRIETTLPRAKELRRVAEQAVTLAKAGTLAARRRATILIKDKRAIQKLFSTLAERFATRNGGYTRIVKVGDRRGDAAPMAIIEYLSAETTTAATEKKAATKKSSNTTKAKKAPEKKKTAKSTPKKSTKAD